MSAKNDIHFLDFRRAPVQHLVSECVGQHGMVLNHTMGTGKTLTATLFLANFPKPFTHMVIAPAGTEAEWVRSIEKVGVNKVGDLDFVTLNKDNILALVSKPKYKDPSKLIIVVDEAHNLIKILTDNLIDFKLRAAVFEWFSKCKKLLLLSGTPFTNSPRDISYIINLAAGKNVVPTAFQDFQDKYYKFNRTKAFGAGWLAPFTKNVTLSVKMLWGLYALIIGAQAFFQIGGHIAAPTVLKHIDSQEKIEKNMKAEDYHKHKWFTQDSTHLSLINNEGAQERDKRMAENESSYWDIGYFSGLVTAIKYMFKDSDGETEDYKALEGLENMDEDQKELFTFVINNVFTGFPLGKGAAAGNIYLTDLREIGKKMLKSEEVTGDKTLKEIMEQTKKELGDYFPIFVNSVLPPLIGFLKILAVIDSYPKFIASILFMHLFLFALVKIESIKDFYDLNTENIARDISPYISSYNPFLSKDKEILKHYPISKEHVKYTTLSIAQMQSLYMIMTNKLSGERLLKMGFVQNVKELEMYRADDSVNFYKNFGRIVSCSESGSAIPSKFLAIFDMHRKKKEPTLVFSSFPGGMANFRKYAQLNGFKTDLIPTDQAGKEAKQEMIKRTLQGDIDFLCLPYYATEGTDVPGMRVFHILEPCVEIVTYKQLMARVIRYSHTASINHTVDIYTWVAKMPLPPAKVLSFMKFWKTHGSQRVPWLFSKEITQTQSPDVINITDLRKASKIFTKIQKDLMRLASFPKNQMAKELSCCIYNPNKPCKDQTCQDFYKKTAKSG